MATLTELSNARELMVNLTLRELRGKYKRSVLGWAWSLFNPLVTMAIFTVVFLVFLRVRIPPGDPSGMNVFAFYLLCGLLPWNFLSNGMNGGMTALINNATLIQKVYFPREILVAANVASWLVSLLIELAVFAVALLIVGNMVLPWLPAVLVLVAVQAVFVIGIGLLLSVLNVYFRDVQHLMAILLQFWFYSTPIVYPLTVVPTTVELFGFDLPLRAVYELNPMVRFVEAYRDLLYDLRFPGVGDIAYLLAVSALALAIGLVVFNRLEPNLAEEL
ncbi:MAG: ABC transporter permease [Actinobacteria bacterium]|nr:ABC transporter permease [Actinomycetota bacterium]